MRGGAYIDELLDDVQEGGCSVKIKFPEHDSFVQILPIFLFEGIPGHKMHPVTP